MSLSQDTLRTCPEHVICSILAKTYLYYIYIYICQNNIFQNMLLPCDLQNQLLLKAGKP